jgi:hypothetical protein
VGKLLEVCGIKSDGLTEKEVKCFVEVVGRWMGDIYALWAASRGACDNDLQ